MRWNLIEVSESALVHLESQLKLAAELIGCSGESVKIANVSEVFVLRLQRCSTILSKIRVGWQIEE